MKGRNGYLWRSIVCLCFCITCMNTILWSNDLIPSAYQSNFGMRAHLRKRLASSYHTQFPKRQFLYRTNIFIRKSRLSETICNYFSQSCVPACTYLPGAFGIGQTRALPPSPKNATMHKKSNKIEILVEKLTFTRIIPRFPTLKIEK